MAQSNPVSPQLTRLSKTMAWLATLGAILLPVVAAACFLFPGRLTDWTVFRLTHTGVAVTAQIPQTYRALALALYLIPTGFEVWAMWSLRRLFLLYAKGEVFSQSAIAAINHVAAGLFWSVIAGLLLEAPVSLALSWPQGHGHRAISIGFGSDDLLWLFVAGTVLAIARVMAEARRVADENAGFV